MAAMMFWAEVVKPSNDQGPYKLIRVKADGHEFTATVVESQGFHGSPMQGGKVLIALPDGDMGKAVALGGVPPKDRRDGQKEAEVGMKNHKAGTVLYMHDDGSIELKGDIKITGSLELTGDFTHTGNYTQSGVHTDSNGPHTA